MPGLPRCTAPLSSQTTTSFAPDSNSSRSTAEPAAPAPAIAILTVSSCLPTTRSALVSAASTAIVVLAALTNALRVVGKQLDTVKIAMAGAGAAGSAVLRLLLLSGAKDVVVCDDKGAVHRGRPGMDDSLRWVAQNTNPHDYAGDLAGAVRGTDVFIGLSVPGILTGDDIAAMNSPSIVFALANPDPEVDPDAAAEHAAVVATGRSDYPNQINNVLAFPGVFRGLLDAQGRTVTDHMLLAAARALASVVSADELGPNYIIPSVFHADVATVVAAAVRDEAGGSGQEAGS